MARKVVIDCDPGIDDAVALCMALFDPRLEVLAITATAGNVSAAQATRNVQTVVELLDPPRLPRIGAASPVEDAPAIDSRNIHGPNGLGGAGLAFAELHHLHPSEKVLYDAIRANPDQVTIIALGPLTNISRIFQRDPSVASAVNRIIMMGGCRVGRGNVTPAAEYNVYYDPNSARAVFRSLTTKTLVPLDVTGQVNIQLDFLNRLPPETTRVGHFLRQVVPFAFRSHRQILAMEGILLHDAVALVAATNPELFEMVEMSGDVETGGEIATGATVFDSREQPTSEPNMEVATEVNVAAVTEQIVRSLAEAGRQT